MAKKEKISFPESRQEVIKGMPDVDDISNWIIDGTNKKVTVLLICMSSPEVPSIGQNNSSAICEVAVRFDGIGFLTESKPRHWAGYLCIKDDRYRFEKRRFYFDTKTEKVYILAKGSKVLPI